MPAARTYEPIATTTLGSAASSVTFSSIPSTYTDLILVVNGSTTIGSGSRLRIGNGSVDTGSNYSFTFIEGTGSATNAFRNANVAYLQMNNYSQFAPSPTYNTTEIVQIMDYANTTTFKTLIQRSNLAQTGVSGMAGLWSNTSAINVVTYYCSNATTFEAGFTATLYGVKAA
jgi:hypothetical protein